MTATPISIVITASGASQVAAEAQRAAAGLERISAASKTAGVSAAQTAQAMRMLPAQITDIVTGLASGQSPFTVLIQQGGQLKDSFGGIVPAARALVGAITPLSAAVVGIGAAATAAALAVDQAQKEQAAYSAAIASTGNAAGVTIGALSAYAKQVSAVAGTTGAAAETVSMLTATGRVAGSDIAMLATVAIQKQRLLGVEVKETVAAFASLGKDPVTASLKLNEGTNYLTASILRQIMAFKAMGQDAQAAALAQTAYAESQKRVIDDARQNLGYLDRAMLATKDVAKGMWDAIVGVGRPKTLEDRAAEINAELDKRRANRTKPAWGMTGTTAQEAEAAGEARLSAQATAIGKVLLSRDNAAAYDTARVQENQQALTAVGTAQAVARKDEQAAADRAEAKKARIKTEREDLEAAFKAELVLREEYLGKTQALNRRELQADLELVRARRTAEEQSTPADPGALLAKQTKIASLRAQESAIRTAMARNEGSVDRAFAADRAESNNAAVAASMRGDQQRLESAQQAAADLVEANRQASIAVIKDDRARGEAQIAYDKQIATARVAALGEGTAAHAAAMAAINATAVRSAQQLTEQLKPEWQRMLEGWQDTTKLMKDSLDSGLTSALSAAEDAFVSFAQTGKLSFRGLINSIIADMARAQFRSSASSLLPWLKSVMGLTGGDNITGAQTAPGEALGGVYGASGRLAFASGGIVTAPTTFRFASGGSLRQGLMGEAGPEGILPLGRDAKGRLGVRTVDAPAAPANNTIIVQGDASANTLRLINGALAQFEARMMLRGAV